MSSQKSSAPAGKTVKTPRRRRGRERVAALREAAMQVFAEAGYEAATMTAIAERAGASIGSLYQFFPTKEHLAADIHSRHLDTLATLLESLVEESRGMPVDAVTDRLFERLVAFLEAHPAFVVLGERRSLDPAVKKKVRARLRGHISTLLGAVNPPVPVARHAPLAAVVLHAIRVAALLRADDDVAIRAEAVAELRVMLRRHLTDGAANGSAARPGGARSGPGR